MTVWLLLACSGSGEASFAVDELYLEPDGDDIVGFQVWELYDESYPASGAFVCGQVFALSGTPTDAWDCAACTQQWEVTVSLVETDCPGSWASGEALGGLSAVGIGALGPSLSDDDPFPGDSSGGYTDQGDGQLTPHGWAFPAALENGGEVLGTEWGTEQPWVLEPAWAWDLGAE